MVATATAAVALKCNAEEAGAHLRGEGIHGYGELEEEQGGIGASCYTKKVTWPAQWPNMVLTMMA